MIKQKSLIKNAIYNFTYTGLNLLFPIVVAPYVSRVLGAPNLGKVDFATTIVNWFLLFATFGTTTYGVREIAKVRDDEHQRDRIFSEIFTINALLSAIVLLIYMIIVFRIEKFYVDLPLYLILGLSIILNMLAIDWFYQGIEEYRFITIRSAILKMFSLLCILLFVNQADHYVIYGLISVAATGLSGFLNFLYSRRYVRLRIKNTNPFGHFRYLSIFFLHTFIVNIYTNLDQVLAGFIINFKAVAFINRSKAIIGVAIALSTAISNVTLPRASYYKANDEHKFRGLMIEVPNYILWITLPMTFGCICLAHNIMYILGGMEFVEGESLLRIIALTIIFSPLSAYFQYQVLVASGEEKVGLYCAIVTSLISLILNIILIPAIGFIGAGIVRVIAEFTAVGTRYLVVKRKLGYCDIRLINRSTVLYLIAAIIMAGIVTWIRVMVHDLYLSFVIAVIVGATVYFGILLFAREKITISLLNKVKMRLAK